MRASKDALPRGPIIIKPPAHKNRADECAKYIEPQVPRGVSEADPSTKCNREYALPFEWIAHHSLYYAAGASGCAKRERASGAEDAGRDQEKSSTTTRAHSSSSARSFAFSSAASHWSRV